MREWVPVIIVVVVFLLVFADMIPPMRWLLKKIDKWRGADGLAHITMSPDTHQRLEQLRQDCERLAGKPVSMGDLIRNAISVYDEAVREHKAGSSFAIHHKDGRRVPFRIFEESDK